MTRSELEKVALGLPDSERAALVGTLVESLSQAGLAVLRGRLAGLEEIEMEILGVRLETQLAEWFQGSGKKWTDEDWNALERGEYRHPAEEDALAVPPGWRQPSANQGA